MKAFVVDVSKCHGCYCCQFACKDEHCGNDWTPYAKPQPQIGQFWGRINEYVRGQVPQVKMAYVFVPCQHCEDAPCVAACPIDGALYTRDDGMVIIDPKHCTGCRSCVDACPYGAIFFNEALNLAQKCTGCAHLLDRGWPIKEPRCVDVCPHSAITFGDEEELSELIGRAQVLRPEFGLKPRVRYIGLPKRFVAGTVYDPATKEVVIGASCTLVGENGAQTAELTDEFGDFWFEGLNAGAFELRIEKADKVITLEVDTRQSDVGLGDMALV